jgi:Glutathione S-transferase, N-terminal domain
MDLYVCYDFMKNVRTTGRPGGHPCGNAHVALKEAGHQPRVEAVHGLGLKPFDRTKGRAKVEELSGQRWVPVLVTDDGQTIAGSKEIIAWAKANPAT